MKGGFGTEPWCRTCIHGYSYHVESRPRLERLFFKLLGCTKTGCIIGPWCSCKQFVPKDNLILIEWIAKEKKLI